MSSSYWKICIPGPDGEEVCTELFAELPPQLGGPERQQVATLTEIETLVDQVTDAAVRVRLLEVLDEAAIRLNNELPDGIVLRPRIMADNDEGGEVQVGVPYVVGMTHSDGWDVL